MCERVLVAGRGPIGRRAVPSVPTVRSACRRGCPAGKKRRRLVGGPPSSDSGHAVAHLTRTLLRECARGSGFGVIKSTCTGLMLSTATPSSFVPVSNAQLETQNDSSLPGYP